MTYQTAQEAAQRLGVSPRSIQKWANDGKIPGAQKVGRGWMIPANAVVLADETFAQGHPFRMPMPLLNSSFAPGQALNFIDALPNADDRAIAMGEYYYFSGQAEKAAETVEQYLDSPDESLSYSAALLYTFSNLSRGHIHLAHFALNSLHTYLERGLRSQSSPQLRAIGIFTATTANVLLHLPVPNTPPLEDYLRYLPDGLRLYGCYVLAHRAYLEKNYERCLAIADMGLSLFAGSYPIATVYLHLAAVMALMNLKRFEDAQQRFAAAWALAEPDGFIEPFGEHHGLLQGMVEIHFKKNHPELFERIISITYSFSAGWRRVHKNESDVEIADNLTTTEFTIAMLYNRGWTVKEIAAHMDISPRTVNRMVSTIYEKLGVSNREMLGKYMLQ